MTHFDLLRVGLRKRAGSFFSPESFSDPEVAAGMYRSTPQGGRDYMTAVRAEGDYNTALNRRDDLRAKLDAPVDALQTAGAGAMAMDYGSRGLRWALGRRFPVLNKVAPIAGKVNDVAGRMLMPFGTGSKLRTAASFASIPAAQLATGAVADRWHASDVDTTQRNLDQAAKGFEGRALQYAQNERINPASRFQVNPIQRLTESMDHHRRGVGAAGGALGGGTAGLLLGLLLKRPMLGAALGAGAGGLAGYMSDPKNAPIWEALRDRINRSASKLNIR